MKPNNTTQATQKETFPPGNVSSFTAILNGIGKEVFSARMRKNLTIEQVAEKSGVSTVTISNLEKGKLNNTTIKNLFLIAESVNLKLSFSLNYQL